MLLVVDVGNTNITLGLFDGEKLNATFRMTSKAQRTSDEYGVLLVNMIAQKGMDISRITDVIIASVVPNIMHSFVSAIIKYLGRKPFIVGPGTKTGIRIVTGNPQEIGADR